MKYFGFAHYAETGKIDSDFIHDFNYWIGVVYHRWSLFIEYDDFYSICWTALMARLPLFDPKIATIQTYCISTINNEAWRRYMKNKATRPECDCDDEVVATKLYTEVDNIKKFQTYIEQAKSLNIKVEEDWLEMKYQKQDDDIFTSTLNWWVLKQKSKGLF